MTFAAVTLDPANKSSYVTLSGGNLTAAVSGGTGRVTATRPITGKTYFEILVNNASSARIGFGCGYAYYANLNNALGSDYHGYGYDASGTVYYNGSSIKTLAAFAATNVIGVAIDPINGLAWFRINNGNWNNAVIGSENPVGAVGGIPLSNLMIGNGAGAGAMSFVPAVGGASSANFTAQFTSGSWTYSAPSGFSAISSYGVSAANSASPQNMCITTTKPSAGVVCKHPATKRGGKQFTVGNAGSPLGAAVSISGNVKEAGSNVARTVFLFDNNTGELLDKVLSDPSTGNFTILARGRSQVICVALDPTSFQAQVYDRLTPA